MEMCESKREQARFSGHVLVAEDTKTNQISMRFLLKKMGVETTIAEDGKQAFQKALAGSFDLILMDIQMPHMDGYQATKALREEGITIPIIALTSNTTKEDERRCLETGCDDYLPKPVDRLRLAEKLGKYLSGGETMPDQSQCSGSQSDRSNLSCPAMPSADWPDEPDAESIIDWGALVGRGFSEALVAKIMPMCIEDNKERLKELTAALSTRHAENVRLHAHAMKGSFANVGAVGLAEVACCLEETAKRGDLSDAERLLANIRESFQSLQTFVSKANWLEIAKGTAQRQVVGIGSKNCHGG